MRRGGRKKKEKPIKTLPFERTPLGSFLRRNSPQDYKVIAEAVLCGQRRVVDLVEAISYKSQNSCYRSVEFRQALSDYRRYRNKTPNEAELDVDEEIKNIRQKLGLD